MFSRVANSDAYFRSQQKDEADFTVEQKLAFASEIYENKPLLFLSRFWKYLLTEDLVNFASLRGDYEVDFYCDQIRTKCETSQEEKSRKLIRNRRYNAIQGLLKNGYFSEESMMQREPLLYHQLVGQYLSEEERLAQIQERQAGIDGKLSSVLMKCIDNEQMKKSRELQQDFEDGAVEEEEDEDEEEAEERNNCELEDDEEIQGVL